MRVSRETVSASMLSLLLMGVITMAFNLQGVKSELATWTIGDDGLTDFPKMRNIITELDPADAFQASINQRFEPKIESFFQNRSDTRLMDDFRLPFEASDKWALGDEVRWSDLVYDDCWELVIGLDDTRPNSYSELEELIGSFGGELVDTISMNGKVIAVVTHIPHRVMPDFASEVEIARVSRYIEPNIKFELDFAPNDPGWSRQWGAVNIEADDAWDMQTGDSSVLVAVIDTGVDWNHPDLAPNYVELGYDWVNNDPDPMDDHGHGTHCAGIIAAVLNNSIGIAGLAQVRIMAEKGLGPGGGRSDDLAKAIVHAVDQGADILSCSWGSSVKSTVVHEALKYAYDHGMLVIGAAGNDATSVKHYPAAYNEVVAVTATDESDNLAEFSNFGDWIGVAAPGVHVYSTVWDDSYAYMSGTSMSAPHVSGVAALIWSQFPGMTRDQVQAQLWYTADDVGDPGFDVYYGYGRVNARRAVKQAIPDHDILVLNWKPPHCVNVGSQVTINATILNMGAAPESGITVQLLINNSIVDSKIISSLMSGTSTSVSCLWIPTVEGVYNLTLYAVPVLGETVTKNNVLFEYVLVRMPEVIKVPDDYETIQSAVDAALDGDTVFVASGTYCENVWIDKENLTLLGEDQANTIIDGGGENDVLLLAADNVKIDGFTIQNSGSRISYVYPPYSGIIVYGSNGHTISNTTTSNNCIGICLFQGNDINLRDNKMIGNMYNFGVEGYHVTDFTHDITTSNTVDGKPIYYWVNQQNSRFPADAGYIAAVNSVNITLKDQKFTNNYQGALFAYSINSTIENVNASSNYIAIHLVHSRASTVVANTATDSRVGIQLQDSKGNDISCNTFAYHDKGFNLYNSFNNTINSNNMSHNDLGLSIEKSNSNMINQNRVFDNTYGIYLRNSGYNTLRNSNMTNNEYNFGVTGTHLSHFVQDIDTSNTVNSKPVYYWLNQKDKKIPVDAGYAAVINSTSISVKDLTLTNNGQGVLLAYTTNSIITNVITTNNYNGICLWSSDSNNISGNNVTKNEWDGIGLYSSHYNTIEGNKATDNAIGIDIHAVSNKNTVDNNILSINIIGIMLYYSDDNILSGNDVTGGGIPGSLAGISLTRSKGNILSGNAVSDNQFFIGAGIYFEWSSNNNTIVQNRLTNNQYGISLGWGGLFGSIDQNNNNAIYHNNLIENTKQVLSLNSINTWDNGHPSGGNYWSDYNVTDLHGGEYQNETGSDGIGDSSYIIDENNQDNYPLMKPYLICDLNHDGYVGIDDLIIAGEAFGSNPYHPRWNPNADINQDNYVGVDDIVLIAKNFGKTYP